MTYKLCLIGCGNVGHGFIKLLREREAWLRRHDFAAKIVAICDIKKGSVIAPEGLDLARLDAALNAGDRLDLLLPETENLGRGLDAQEVIRESGADVVLELTPTDLRTGQPATAHIEQALRLKKHVITTNKGPVALFWRRLKGLAEERGVQFRFEGTVMSGTPVFTLVESGLAGPIRSVRGILNGTTNFILTRMEEGMEYADALAEAQRRGYAETDPTADVEGYDALAKITILANVLLGGDLDPWEVPVQGITAISHEEVRRAVEEGFRYKLIAQAAQDNGRVSASVGPKRLPLSDPLSQIAGTTNAITFEFDPLGQVTIIGPGAGRLETGHAILSDLLAIHRNHIPQQDR